MADSTKASARKRATVRQAHADETKYQSFEDFEKAYLPRRHRQAKKESKDPGAELASDLLRGFRQRATKA